MRRSCLILFLLLPSSSILPAQRPQKPLPRFEAEEIDRRLEVGYAVLLEDVNADGTKDIVVVDTTRVIWFENPSWKMRTIIQGQTKPDNVCITAHDIDQDGRLDFALGAGWRGTNTRDPGTIQWLQQGDSLDELWKVHPIDTEISVHRMRFFDLDGDGKPELISAPLLGPGATRDQNFSESPVRLRAYRIPDDPTREKWTSQVLEGTLHVMHNFWADDLTGDGSLEVLTASYEGVHLLERNGSWKKTRIGEGNQEDPQARRGASEIKLGRLRNGNQYIATIEPWHGHQVVVYTPREGDGTLWERHVIDEQLKWGHGVWCADLNGDGGEELIIGVRDPFNEQISYGVNVYQARDARGRSWEKQVVENGGVAVEDLTAGDLNRDGRIDIVAVGRATGNVKIYWNRGR